MNPLAGMAAIHVSITVLVSGIVFARSHSTLRAFVVALGFATVVWLAVVALAVSGYANATVAVAGPAPRARIVLDARVVPSAMPVEPDRVALVWRLWASGKLRVEPEPAFLTTLRWVARAAPGGTLEWVRRLSPHGPSV